MSQQLTIDNYGPLNIYQTDRLDADTAVNDQSIVVENTNGYQTGRHALIGSAGVDSSELVQLQTVTSATAVSLVATLKLPHQRFDKFLLLFGDQVKIYRAPNVNNLPPADSTYALLQTLTINYDEQTTFYTDAAGSDSFWYKFTYADSTSGAETNLGECLAGRGGGSGDYCSLDAIRVEAGFKNNFNIRDSMIEAKRKAAQAEIDGALTGLYYIPFQKPINAFITDLTARLAAGLLLTEQFGVYNTLNTNNGSSKLKDARDQLKKLQTSQMSLTDIAGNDLGIPNEGSVAGWPNATTNGLDSSLSGDSGPRFRSSTRY